MISRIVGIRIWNRETFRYLLQHGKAHGDMKPVDDMLCPRVQPIDRNSANSRNAAEVQMLWEVRQALRRGTLHVPHSLYCYQDRQTL